MPTLLLHGLGGERSQPLGLFGPVLRASGVADAEVVALDVRAHGSSTAIGAPGDFELDALARELAVAYRAERADAGAGPDDDAPLTVIGISMGAALALRLTLGRLLPVERAVFVRPAFTDDPLPHNLAMFPVIAQLLHEHPAPIAARHFHSTGLFAEIAGRSKAGAEALLEQFRAPLARERAIRLAEVPRNRAFEAELELARIGVPSLVIAAERDPVHPVAVAEQWAAGLTGSTLERVPARDDGLPAQRRATREHLAEWLAAHPV